MAPKTGARALWVSGVTQEGCLIDVIGIVVMVQYGQNTRKPVPEASQGTSTHVA